MRTRARPWPVSFQQQLQPHGRGGVYSCCRIEFREQSSPDPDFLFSNEELTEPSSRLIKLGLGGADRPLGQPGDLAMLISFDVVQVNRGAVALWKEIHGPQQTDAVEGRLEPGVSASILATAGIPPFKRNSSPSRKQPKMRLSSNPRSGPKKSSSRPAAK